MRDSEGDGWNRPEGRKSARTRPGAAPASSEQMLAQGSWAAGAEGVEIRLHVEEVEGPAGRCRVCDVAGIARGHTGPEAALPREEVASKRQTGFRLFERTGRREGSAGGEGDAAAVEGVPTQIKDAARLSGSRRDPRAVYAPAVPWRTAISIRRD